MKGICPSHHLGKRYLVKIVNILSHWSWYHPSHILFGCSIASRHNFFVSTGQFNGETVLDPLEIHGVAIGESERHMKFVELQTRWIVRLFAQDLVVKDKVKRIDRQGDLTKDGVPTTDTHVI